MPADLIFPFLFVLARVSGIFAFAPIPGIKTGPDALRLLLSVAVTVALFPVWPDASAVSDSAASVTSAIFSEAALGTAFGLAVAVTLEALQMAAQIAGLQAGYGYASTIDPTTQADSPVLLIAAQMFSGLLFFAIGLDREVIRACAQSFQTFPPGRFVPSLNLAQSLIHLSAGIFSVGARLALPAIALLGMLDLSLALLGRANAQLQLITLTFPIKMLAALVLTAFTSVLFARTFAAYAAQAMAVLRGMVAMPAMP